MINNQRNTNACTGSNRTTNQLLTPVFIRMIEEALLSLGDFGEVRLIVEKGRLRFLVTHKSYDILKWHQGGQVKEFEPEQE